METCNYCDKTAVALYNVPSPMEKPVSGKVGDWSSVYVCQDHEAAVKGSATHSVDLNYGKYSSSNRSEAT